MRPLARARAILNHRASPGLLTGAAREAVIPICMSIRQTVPPKAVTLTRGEAKAIENYQKARNKKSHDEAMTLLENLASRNIIDLSAAARTIIEKIK